MALSTKERRELLMRDLPKAAAVRRQLTDYMARTGLRPEDLKTRIGYSTSSVRHFLSGRYESVASTTGPICAAILDFISSHPVAAFHGVEGKLYETENVRLIKKYF